MREVGIFWAGDALVIFSKLDGFDGFEFFVRSLL